MLACLTLALFLAPSVPAEPVRVEVGFLCPSDLSATAQADGTIRLDFAADVEANGTRVYRSDGTGPLVQIAELGAGVEVYLDADVVANVVFTYEVRALLDVALSCPQASAIIESSGCATSLAARLRDDGIMLHVQAGTAVALHKQVGNQTALLLADLEAGTTARLDADVEAGQHYTYIVILDGQDCVSVTVEIPTTLEVEVDVEVDADACIAAKAMADGSVELTLGSGVFNIYRAEAAGQAVLIAQVNGSTFMDANTTVGTTYTYWAKPVVAGVELDSCGVVEVTAIPVFPTYLGAGLAATSGSIAYVAFRRRK